MDSIYKCLPYIKIEGCFFHIVQSLWRQMQIKGLAKSYLVNKEMHFNFNRLKCLTFVPHNQVIHCFKIIQSQSNEDFDCITAYFEKFYIGKSKLYNINRAVPAFAI